MPPGLPRDVFISLAEDLETVENRFAELIQLSNPNTALSAVGKIVDRRSPVEEAVMYKVAVLDVASEVARASGPFLRSKVSKKERTRILSMQKWLRLDRADFLAIYEQYNAQDRAPDAADAGTSGARTSPDRQRVTPSLDTDPEEALAAITRAYNRSEKRTDTQSSDGQGAGTHATKAWTDAVRRLGRGGRKPIKSSEVPDTGETIPPRGAALGQQITQRIHTDMSIDATWTINRHSGFTWWAGKQAQRLEWLVNPVSPAEDSVIVVAATDIAEAIRDTDVASEAANAINMSAGLSAVIIDRDDRSAKLISSISVHSDTMHHTRTLSLAAGFQVAEAHELGEALAEALDGRLAESTHPSTGSRSEPDEMLQVLASIPFSQDPVPLDKTHFAAAIEICESAHERRLFAEANVDSHGLVAEFPFDHGIPAAGLDPGNPVSFLGTSLLTISRLDAEAGKFRSRVRNRRLPRAVLSKDTGAYRRYGSGLYVRLGLPVQADHATMIATAEHLNRLESQGASGNHLLGAWYGEDTGIWFTAFYPNMLFASLERDQRIASLTNIVLSLAARSAWAKEPSEQLINTRRSPRSSIEGAFRPSELDAFLRFTDTGIYPMIIACELKSTFHGDAETVLPAGARIELWANCEAVGMFRYPHVAAAFNHFGDITAIAAAELLPEQHDSCFLGLFADGLHTNYGNSEDWRDRDTFFPAAISLLASTIE